MTDTHHNEADRLAELAKDIADYSAKGKVLEPWMAGQLLELVALARQQAGTTEQRQALDDRPKQWQETAEKLRRMHGGLLNDGHGNLIHRDELLTALTSTTEAIALTDDDLHKIYRRVYGLIDSRLVGNNLKFAREVECAAIAAQGTQNAAAGNPCGCGATCEDRDYTCRYSTPQKAEQQASPQAQEDSFGMTMRRSEWESLSPEAQAKLVEMGKRVNAQMRVYKAEQAKAAAEIRDKPLFATPPKAEATQAGAIRAPLTKDEIDFILADSFLAANGGVYSTRIYDFVTAIDAALRAPPFPEQCPGQDEEEFIPTNDFLGGHQCGLEWAACLVEANYPGTGDWLHDDRQELADAIRKGPEMPEPSTPPQAAQVPEGLRWKIAAIAAECSDPDTTDALDQLLAASPQGVRP